MFKYVVIGFLLFPCLCFGQLFPIIPDYKGHIANITEIGTGKELRLFGIFKKTYYPGLASGWKYIFEFDENSKLIRRTNTYKDEIRTTCIYQSEKVDNRQIEREITSSGKDYKLGDYIEYENFTDASGQIVQVNYWRYQAKDHTRNKYLVENNTAYKDGRLISFNRQNIGPDGTFRNAEKCKLSYNALGQLIGIERMNLESGLTTVLKYHYNKKGLMDHYSIDFLTGLVEYGAQNQSQEFFYEYDEQGNWIKMYLKADEKKRLQAKRKINYRP